MQGILSPGSCAIGFPETIDGYQDALMGLEKSYPGFSAIDRALAVTYLPYDEKVAYDWAGKAVSVNTNDPKARLLLSVIDYANKNLFESWVSYVNAIIIDPEVSMHFWEMEYVIEIKPNVYWEWCEDVPASIEQRYK